MSHVTPTPFLSIPCNAIAVMASDDWGTVWGQNGGGGGGDMGTSPRRGEERRGSNGGDYGDQRRQPRSKVNNADSIWGGGAGASGWNTWGGGGGRRRNYGGRPGVPDRDPRFRGRDGGGDRGWSRERDGGGGRGGWGDSNGYGGGGYRDDRRGGVGGYGRGGYGGEWPRRDRSGDGRRGFDEGPRRDRYGGGWDEGPSSHRRGGGGFGFIDDGPPPPLERYVPREDLSEEALFRDGCRTGINFQHYKEVDCKCTGENVPPPIQEFEESGLRKLLLDNLKKAKYTTPTPVQK